MRVGITLACLMLCALGFTILSADEVPQPASSTAESSSLAKGVEEETVDDINFSLNQEPQKRLAGENAYWKAMASFDGKKTDDLELARETLLEAAERGFSPAQNQLGIYYLTGSNGFRKSERRAVNWFEMAANERDAYAMVNLGRCYLSGTGVWKSHRKAKKWLLEAMGENAIFPQPVPPRDYLDSLPVEEEQTVSLFGSPQEEDSIYKTRINAASLLMNIFAKEKDPEATFTYALLASGFERKSISGNPSAAVTAALALAFGEGVERNRDMAEEILEFSKKLVKRKGMDLAHSLSQAKLMDNLAMGEIEEALKETSENTMALLEYHIAARFSDEDSDESNLSEAIPWYKLAAENGKCWAMLELAFLYNDKESEFHDPEKVFFWFKEAAEKGNHSLGWLNLGICYLQGIGTEPDAEAALKAFRKPETYFGCYMGANGNPPEKILTYEEELDWHKKSIRGRDADPHAIYLMGLRYRHGYGVSADHSKAHRLFSKAAKKGHAEAQYSMGSDYYFGYLNWPDYKKAYELYVEADEMGSESAPFQIAYMSSYGMGCAENLFVTEKYYKKAIEIDPEDGSSWNNLAVLYRDKLGALQKKGASADKERKHELRSMMLEAFTKAKELEVAMGPYNLGLLYLDGGLVEKDLKAAYKYFVDAADLGESNAYYFLGKMHDEGLGVNATPEEAAYNYRMAAVDSDTEKNFRNRSVSRLVFFYRYGVGVPRDNERALYWALYQARLGFAIGWKRVVDLLVELQRYEEAEDLLKQFVRSNNHFLRGHASAVLVRMSSLDLDKKHKQRSIDKYFKTALEHDSSLAFYISGLSLLKKKNYQQAALNFTLAAKNSCFQDDRTDGCSVKIGEEKVLISQDGASELPDAVYQLGCLFYAGKGVQADKEKAWELFIMAAKLGSSPAQFNIGISVLQKDPLAPPLDLALELINMAVNTGYPKAEKIQKLLISMNEENKEKIIEKKQNEKPAASGIYPKIT